MHLSDTLPAAQAASTFSRTSAARSFIPIAKKAHRSCLRTTPTSTVVLNYPLSVVESRHFYLNEEAVLRMEADLEIRIVGATITSDGPVTVLLRVEARDAEYDQCVTPMHRLLAAHARKESVQQVSQRRKCRGSRLLRRWVELCVWLSGSPVPVASSTRRAPHSGPVICSEGDATF